MLLIFGFKVRVKVLEALVFACPQCRTDRQGALVALRRWFTLFFIPVIPLNEVGRAVRCDTCRSNFEPRVLDRPTGAAVGEVRTGAIRVLSALLVGAGDPTSAPLRARAVASIGSVVPGYDDATLTTDLQVLDPAQAPQYVAPLAEALDLGARERFLAELARVATADGVATAGQRQLLDQIGQAMGLTSAHIAGIVATAGTGGAPGFGAPGVGAPPGFGAPTAGGATWPPRPATGAAGPAAPSPQPVEPATPPPGFGPPPTSSGPIAHEPTAPGTLGAPIDPGADRPQGA